MLKNRSLNKERKFLGLRVSAIVEILCFFLFLFFLAKFFHLNFNFFSVCPHPFWIPVVLISTQYGTNEGLLTALISTIILLSGNLPERNILQDPPEYFFLLGKSPFMWFAAAVVLGELRLKHIRERDDLREAVLLVEEKEKKIAESYTALKKVKERLETRVVSDMQTTLMVLSAFSQLENKGKEEIVKGACEMVKALTAPEKFSIYLLENNRLVRTAGEGWEPEEPYATVFDSDTLLFHEIVERKKVVSLQSSPMEVLGTEGVLAVPIKENEHGKVWGMIKIEQIPFMRLRTSAIESLRLTGELVGNAYGHYVLLREQK